jgi:hypothetical protein
MTYKELVQIINTLTKEQQNQSVSINCSDQQHPVWKESEIYPLHRAVIFYGDDRLDDGHFILEI